MTRRVAGDPERPAELRHKKAGACGGAGPPTPVGDARALHTTVVGDGFGRTLLRLRVPLLVL